MLPTCFPHSPPRSPTHKPKWLTFTETSHIRKLAQQLHRGGFLHSQVAGVVGSPHAEGTARRRVQTSQGALQGRPCSELHCHHQNGSVLTFPVIVKVDATGRGDRDQCDPDEAGASPG